MNKVTATRKWVDSFNAIPLSLIEKAYKDDYYDSITELTPPTYKCQECGSEFSQSEYEEMEGKCNCDEPLGFAEWCKEEAHLGPNKLSPKEIVELEDEYESYLYYFNSSKLEVKEDYSFYLMWGTMWTFGESIDNWWLENNLGKMAECGFRIYESDELGYFFGINGGGYSFHDSHWIPLYDARGLRWHKEG